MLLSQSLPLRFEHITASDGLSHNKVQCILQDKQGYIWFGTVYGLNRYDGYAFKVFENIPGDSSSIGNNNIISLYQERSGIIWIGTSTIVASFDPRTEKFTNYNLPSLQGWIHDFKETENGNLWIASGYGLFSFDKKTQHETYYATADSAKNNVQSILPDNDKNYLWLATDQGIKKFNIQTSRAVSYNLPAPAFDDISNEITHNIIRDKNGKLWMSTSNQGAYCFDPAAEKFTAYRFNPINPSSAQNTGATEIMEDADGKIWIAGDGLAFYDPLKQAWSYLKTEMSDAEGLPGKIRALIKDRSGIYWLGTERGIAKYDPKLYSFSSVKPNYPYTLQTANTIIEDREHHFWVGNYVGIGLLDTITGNYQNQNQLLGVNKEFVYASIMQQDGSMWFGATGCLFHVYKKDRWKADKISMPDGISAGVSALAFDANGLLWAGTRSGGLFRYNTATATFTAFKGNNTGEQQLLSHDIQALLSISPDSLLVGTEGSGLLLMQTHTGHIEQVKLDKHINTAGIDYSIINALCRDQHQNIWIGTERSGLWQTNNSLSYFQNYSVKDGLQSMNIGQITEDDKGQIWLNTNLGLEIVDPVKKRFVHYSEKDGLSINQPDYLVKKASGDLLRIDLNGMHIFHSSSINLNKDTPAVYINRFQFLDKSIPIYNDTIIYLKYNQNYVSFDYVGLNYTQSFKNRYMYMLEGLDTKWIDAGDRRFATYANLEAGTYTFLVKASNNQGVWNETPAKLILVISQPWWRTWWFYLLVILSITTLAYLSFRYRLKQKLKEMEIRSSISRDLHDEVGSTLSSIGFLSSMALDDADNNAKTNTTLESISESSNRMLDAMNDIIWNIKPENDTLQNIIARMIAFASELLEAKRITLHCNIADNVQHLHLGLKMRYDFYMIFKEAVNNLAKYSEATEAVIILDYQYPFLNLTISDNGKGFDTQNVRDGNGLKNMQSRAKKIGGQYKLNTIPGTGTVITLKVKPA